MENHLKKLLANTQNIEVFIASAYDWVDGKNVPSLGIRDRENKGCCIDEVYWLIAGTARSRTTHKPVQYLNTLIDSVDSVYIDLRAQAIVYGMIVTVDLGKRKIVSMEKADDRIFAKLEVL